VACSVGRSPLRSRSCMYACLISSHSDSRCQRPRVTRGGSRSYQAPSAEGPSHLSSDDPSSAARSAAEGGRMRLYPRALRSLRAAPRCQPLQGRHRRHDTSHEDEARVGEDICRRTGSACSGGHEQHAIRDVERQGRSTAIRTLCLVR
jgi:hypothetical protein